MMTNNMKRSFEHTTGNSDNISIQHSFYRQRATLAAQYNVYDTHSLLDPAGHFMHYDTQPTPYLLHDDPETDSDFQSNAWYSPMPGVLSQGGYPLHPASRPLAGLGISLGTPKLSTPSTATASARLSTPTARPTKPLPKRAIQEDVKMNNFDEAAAAYSQCPSEEFAAPPSAQPPSVASYSPCEDFLILEDSPMLLGPKMDVDSTILSNNTQTSSRPDMSRFLTSPDAASVGIIPDVNYRALAVEEQRGAPILCVNPADITGPGPEASSVKVEDEDVAMDSPELQYPVDPTPAEVAPPADFPEEAVSAIVSVLAASVKQSNTEQILSSSGSVSMVRSRQLVSHPMISVPLPGFAARSVPNPHIGAACDTGGRTPLGFHSVNTPLQEPSPMWAANNMSPVLNAHEGVELEALRNKADSWRRLNPGFELDKTFLQTFAGRLSDRGELIPYYRCYVKGCSQSNKRRDHIMVHVGSHVEHRPFQCETCGMRFLRKNECKRHMSSHAGFKPYACTICPPFLEKTFVRQDLLKRHMKVTHGIVSSGPSGSANIAGRTSKKRAASLSPESEYHP